MEVRELLSKYGFPGETFRSFTVGHCQSWKTRTEEMGEESISELMNAVDNYIPTPDRAIDKPFLMPIEDVFSITGRGTVATGRVERGKVKVGEKIEIVGLRPSKTTCTGIEMFRKLLEEGQAGDNVGSLLRGIERDDIERGQVVAARLDHAAHEVRGRGLRSDQGRRRTAHAVLHRLPPAVLLPHDGRDRASEAAGRHRDGDARRQHRRWTSS